MIALTKSSRSHFIIANMNEHQPIKERVYYPRTNIAVRWVSCGMWGSALILNSEFSMPLMFFFLLCLPAIQRWLPLPPSACGMPKLLFYFLVPGMLTFSLAVFLNIGLGIGHPINQTMRPWLLMVLFGTIFIFICWRFIEDIKLWKKSSAMDSKTEASHSV
jgi:hypothetical protein